MKPRYLLISISCLLSLHSMTAGYLGYDISAEVGALGYAALVIATSWWIYEDAKKQEYWGAQEASAFIIYCWPLMLPIYLLQTRHWKGIALLLGILTLYLMPWAVGWVAYFASPLNA